MFSPLAPADQTADQVHRRTPEFCGFVVAAKGPVPLRPLKHVLPADGHDRQGAYQAARNDADPNPVVTQLGSQVARATLQGGPSHHHHSVPGTHRLASAGGPGTGGPPGSHERTVAARTFTDGGMSRRISPASNHPARKEINRLGPATNGRSVRDFGNAAAHSSPANPS